MISKDRNFSSCNYYFIARFLHGQILFHLDNPDPNPIERKTISNPIQIQRNQNNIRPDWTLKSGSCTPLTFSHITRAFRVFCFNAGISHTMQKVRRGVLSVDHDLVAGSRSNRILPFRTGPGWTGFRKYLYGIGYGYPNCVDHCSRVLNQSFFSDINRNGSNIWILLPVSSEISDLCEISDL